jgi:puromycin-sensitive aminopeptidase
MDTWILQRGFPQLEVVPAGNGIKISQRRYLTIPDESDQTLWQVPVQTRQLGNSDATEKFILKDPEATRPFESANGVIVNAGGHGFYRVRYEGGLFSALVGKLGALDDLERYILIDDTWAFVESGQQSPADYLRLASKPSRPFGGRCSEGLLPSATTWLGMIIASHSPTG